MCVRYAHMGDVCAHAWACTYMYMSSCVSTGVCTCMCVLPAHVTCAWMRARAHTCSQVRVCTRMCYHVCDMYMWCVYMDVYTSTHVFTGVSVHVHVLPTCVTCTWMCAQAHMFAAVHTCVLSTCVT